MPRRQRQEGIVEVVIGPGEQAPKRLEGYDLDKIALSDEWLLALVFKVHGLEPTSQSDRQWLRRIYSKQLRQRRGPKSKDLAFALEMKKAGVTENDSASVAAEKVATCSKQHIDKANLKQKVQRLRRKEKAVVTWYQNLGDK